MFWVGLLCGIGFYTLLTFIGYCVMKHKLKKKGVER